MPERLHRILSTSSEDIICKAHSRICYKLLNERQSLMRLAMSQLNLPARTIADRCEEVQSVHLEGAQQYHSRLMTG
jgi:hypothetical protein